MRLILISDTHSCHDELGELPEGDVLIHAGDMTNQGTFEEVEIFCNWFKSQPHKYKILIAGNHDFLFQTNPKVAQELVRGVHYLQDSEVVLEDFKFYGSPWQPEFHNWAFNLPRGEQLERVWSRIPSDTDILITHGPPAGTLDKNRSGFPCGCEDLAKRLEDLEKLKLHVFGHIHEARGHTTYGDLQLVNASSINLYHTEMREPFVVDL